MGDGAKGVVDKHAAPTKQQIKRWRQYLANERAEAATYREMAKKREGHEREILEQIADAESRHELYWREKLGPEVGMPQKPDWGTRFHAFMARNVSPVFALALMQSAESRSPYMDDEDASDEIAADEAMHAEVVRALATQGRERLSGSFRAAVFGANDGLVSNVALVLGVMGSGVSSSYILLTGISGLLAGALSMAAGEYVSVKSQTELLDASRPDPMATSHVPKLDVNQNELALVYRARGMDAHQAEQRAKDVFAATQYGAGQLGDNDNGLHGNSLVRDGLTDGDYDSHEAVGNALSAGVASFCFFAAGAFIPLIPFILGLAPTPGAVVALILVSIALFATGGLTGLLSGKPPFPRALRQLGIGLGAAGITYVLGMLFGGVVG
ncbi:VIT1/CCC1 transporter family protein [Corynebacterium aquatimens]|uniref:VIT1/CCC1 transporter family protein n=1 Tax=Corynebacterium aquatimens TaxID=1190508 RepID=UPI0025B5A72E|nr:VIT1/CCC1 transporter family protein [Corynebacterium aquatimens]